MLLRKAEEYANILAEFEVIKQNIKTLNSVQTSERFEAVSNILQQISVIYQKWRLANKSHEGVTAHLGNTMMNLRNAISGKTLGVVHWQNDLVFYTCTKKAMEEATAVTDGIAERIKNLEFMQVQRMQTLNRKRKLTLRLVQQAS